MSLPVRQPLSRSRSVLPRSSHPQPTPSSNRNTQPSRDQSARHIPTPSKGAKMAQSHPNSSPLSSVPSNLIEAVSPPRSCQTTSAVSRVTANPEVQCSEGDPATNSAPLDTHVPMMSSTTGSLTTEPAETPMKRTREDDNHEDSPPPKKIATEPSAPAKSEDEVVLDEPNAKKPTSKKARTKKRTPPPSSRPSRHRKAPERFEDLAQPSPVKATPAKKGPGKVFDPVYITTNSTSRLGKADVYHMLLEPAAWTSLSAAQQETLISMLPDNESNKALIAKIKGGQTEATRPPAFTMSNDCFRTDVAKFKEDLKNGHLAKTWQAAAHQAVIARAAGEYDQWKAAEAELWWGQKGKSAP